MLQLWRAGANTLCVCDREASSSLIDVRQSVEIIEVRIYIDNTAHHFNRIIWDCGTNSVDSVELTPPDPKFADMVVDGHRCVMTKSAPFWPR